MTQAVFHYLGRFATAAFSNGIQRRSLTLGAIVGTLLTLVNQGEAIWAGHLPDLLKVFLTYGVPYCVATYAGTSALLNRDSG